VSRSLPRRESVMARQVALLGKYPSSIYSKLHEDYCVESVEYVSALSEDCAV
jgi:hypothetical protein